MMKNLGSTIQNREISEDMCSLRSTQVCPCLSRQTYFEKYLSHFYPQLKVNIYKCKNEFYLNLFNCHKKNTNYHFQQEFACTHCSIIYIMCTMLNTFFFVCNSKRMDRQFLSVLASYDSYIRLPLLYCASHIRAMASASSNNIMLGEARHAF